jgi:raffinose/stachyose/melibiose transport system permease protein
MSATPQTVARTGRAAPPPVQRRRRTDKTFYAMLLPVVLLFTLFITVPAVVGMFYSITDYVGYGEWDFVGLTNYVAIFNDPRILSSYP